MINEATKAKKLGYDLTKIVEPKTGLPLKTDRGDPRQTSKDKEVEKGYKSIFSALQPRIIPVLNAIAFGNYEEIKHTLFVSFTAIPKLGINPKSSYNTPNGIYSYQMNSTNFVQLKARKLPFATSQPYIQFFKIKPQFFDNVAIITKTNGTLPSGSPSLRECYSKYIEKHPEIVLRTFILPSYNSDAAKYQGLNVSDIPRFSRDKDFLMCFSKIVRRMCESHFKSSFPIELLWTLGYNLQDINKWSYLFVNDFKIYGVIDEGTSTIHPSEPYQSVFFSSKFIEHLSQIENPYLGPKKSFSFSKFVPEKHSIKKNTDGSIDHFNNGKLSLKMWVNAANEPHRDGAPAKIYFHPSGDVSAEYWYNNGKLHRTDGPAANEYDLSGSPSEEIWFFNNERHRIDGPAQILYDSYDGSILEEHYYVNNNELTKDEFQEWQKKKGIIKESKIFSKINIRIK